MYGIIYWTKEKDDSPALPTFTVRFDDLPDGVELTPAMVLEFFKTARRAIKAIKSLRGERKFVMQMLGRTFLINFTPRRHTIYELDERRHVPVSSESSD